MRTMAFGVLSGLLLACTGGDGLPEPKVEPGSGLRTDVFFPTDGTRRAEYVNAAPDEVPWLLVVEKLEPTELVGGVELVTFEWSRSDTEEVLGAVKWAQDDGIAIYGWAEGTGAFVMFDPPIVLSDNKMYRGDVIETVTGGYTFTSTYIGPEDCTVAWGLDWQDCPHFTLDDGDGDPMAGPLFAGDYWLVERYGPAWMHTTGYAGKWDLQEYDWDAGG